jgi:hypothetical protein
MRGNPERFTLTLPSPVKGEGSILMLPLTQSICKAFAAASEPWKLPVIQEWQIRVLKSEIWNH